MQKILPIGIIVITLIIGIGFYVSTKSEKILSSKTYSLIPSLLQLQADLRDITPHFIDTSQPDSQTNTPIEQKIKDDVIALLIAKNSDNDAGYYSRLRVTAIGGQYVLVTQPSAGSAFDAILDSKTGEVSLVSGEARYYLVSEGRDIALYIDNQAIHTYALNQAYVVLVSGSQLSGNETYNSGTSDAYLVPEQTHTKNSITISVFDSSQMIQNPQAQANEVQTMNKKVRSITLSF